MKHRDQFHRHAVLLAFSLALGVQVANAEETSAATAIGTSGKAESKLGSEFAGFLGGTEQAHAVVDGLRQGTAFLYVKPETPEAIIDPPTGSMGYGNVRITLRMAQAELGKLGIAQPSAEELSAVLLGGEIDGAPVDGILAMRAEGMGWGQIAQQYGTTVGQIMGKGAGLAKQAYIPSQASPGGKNAPGSTGKAAQHARANGYIPSGNGKALGYGIVSGTGASVSVTKPDGGKGLANKPAAGSGMVSAGGQGASVAGVSNAGGGAKGLAPGQAKKN